MSSEEAFAQLYQDTRGPLWAYIYRCVGNPGDADDIAQEAYLRFLRAAAAPRDPTGARRYVFTIASNLVRDRWRSAERHQSWLTRWLTTTPRVAPPFVEPSARLAREASLAGIFNRLGPRDRALLWLAHVEQLGHAEIGEILNLRPGSVKVMVHRARARLRDLMQGDSQGSSRDA